MILVVGATGTIGRYVVRGLQERNVPARALIRPAALATAGHELTGIDLACGDVTDPPSLAAAMHGVEQVFLTMSNGPGQLDHEQAVVRAAAQAGVTHLVKVSAPVVGADVPVQIARTHHAIEQTILATGLSHTFLRPYAFMQNLLNMAPTIRMAGFFTGITGNALMNMVDARDIADVAVTTLTSSPARGPLVLTGRVALSYPEVARQLTALGRPTAYVNLPTEEYQQTLRRAGAPHWLVEHLTEIQTLTLNNPERPTDTVADLTGRQPRTLDAFLHEHLASHLTGPRGWRERLAAVPLRIQHRKQQRRGEQNDPDAGNLRQTVTQR
ncbi:MAG: NmrA family NAD(P)-binding protein [Nocardioides sp.]